MRRKRHIVQLVLLATAIAIAAGPGNAQTLADNDKFPNVLSAKVQSRGATTFDFDVTVSSPYDTAQRYADGFRVTGADGRVFGERKLFHDHADEQPFTRDLHGVTIPPGIGKVMIQARDQQYGYGGKSIDVPLPGR
jgi:hypothetical protein